MNRLDMIAALDLGTSKIVAGVAQKDGLGALSILQLKNVDSGACMRRGCVFNLDMAAGKVSQLIDQLNFRLDSPFEKIYIGIGGQSLRSESYSVKKEVKDGIVTQNLLDVIKEEVKNYKPELVEVLEILPPEYFLDGQPVSYPRGATASAVEARFRLIVGRPSLKRDSANVVRNKIEIAGFFISPLATAEAVLTKKEKEAGCAFIEFGAGVTYLSIYKNNSLKYLITLPLGGLAITKDIRGLNVLEKEAEKLKINYGSALWDLNNQERVKINEELSPEIEVKNLNMIIEARTDEIIKNINHQIEESGYSELLDAGIIITGGASSLRKLPESIRNHTGKEVRIGNVRIQIHQGAEWGQQPAYSCLIGLLTLGEDCCSKEKKQSTTQTHVFPYKFQPRPPKGENKKEVKQEDKQEKKQEKKQEDRHDDGPEVKQGGIFGKIRKSVKKGLDDMSNSLFNAEDFYDNESEAGKNNDN